MIVQWGDFLAKIHTFGSFFTSGTLKLAIVANPARLAILTPLRIGAGFEAWRHAVSGRLRVDISTSKERVSMINRKIDSTENHRLKTYLPPSHADDIGLVSCSVCVGLVFGDRELG